MNTLHELPLTAETAASPVFKPLPRRAATAADIIRLCDTHIRFDMPVRFRHFIVETARRNAANGVAHRQYSRSKLYVLDGVPFVNNSGKMEGVTADVVTLDNGREILADLRIDSPHLPK